MPAIATMLVSHGDVLTALLLRSECRRFKSCTADSPTMTLA